MLNRRIANRNGDAFVWQNKHSTWISTYPDVYINVLANYIYLLKVIASAWFVVSIFFLLRIRACVDNIQAWGPGLTIFSFYDWTHTSVGQIHLPHARTSDFWPWASGFSLGHLSKISQGNRNFKIPLPWASGLIKKFVRPCVLPYFF